MFSVVHVSLHMCRAGFRVFKRLQLVVRLLPEFQFVTGNFPRVYYPIFWVNDGGLQFFISVSHFILLVFLRFAVEIVGAI